MFFPFFGAKAPGEYPGKTLNGIRDRICEDLIYWESLVLKASDKLLLVGKRAQSVCCGFLHTDLLIFVPSSRH